MDNFESKCKHFWKWFEQNSDLLFNFENDTENIFNLLGEELHQINEDLVFEFGPIKDNKREFTLSADGIRDAFPVVESLYDLKPELEKWIIIKFRQRKDISQLVLNINGTTLSSQDMYCRLFRDDPKIGILAFVKDYDRELHGSMIFILLDMAIGEYDMETKVGEIHFLDFDSDYFSDELPLTALPESFDEAYGSIAE